VILDPLKRLKTRRRLLALLTSVFSGYAHANETSRRQSSAPLTDHASRITPFAHVVPGYRLRFPQDEGSHPAFRTEWWYITGWLDTPARAALGFQITFFRTRPAIDENNPSTFTPRQIIIAHAALSDLSHGKLLHDQRVARAVLGLAGAEEGRTNVWIDDWSLAQEGREYKARAASRDFVFDLSFAPTQSPVLQGEDGVSRKGPRRESASYYYSIPHLRVAGTVGESGKRVQVEGSAWFDHEWSSSYMDERASGWDWIGINLDDGGALMAFRMRDRAGATFWAGGSYREPRGNRRAFASDEIEFIALRTWRSPRTGTTYPVSWRVRAGAIELTLEPLMDDQESDTRVSVGAVYWEGAVRAIRDKKPVGRGYLELTGYGQPLRL
jgi:predicted secreted hydrolase